ncbi:MAG: FMN-dependent NADH-azoreductase [Marivita sp.]|uniref:FMN-dependent NADH-azoreductase n=1 Tax=Marivita sp. TaxID=2003365 RepID=UPI003EF52DD8
MTQTVLRIDTSIRGDASVSRDITDKIIAKLAADTVITRDLSKGLPLIDASWLGANWTAEADRSPEQKDALALSDALIAEIIAADTLVIGMPFYNFAVPGALKAWVDLIARAGITFVYTETGPKGLLDGKRAIFAVASGGTLVGSDIDFATGYMRHIMGFIGITDVQIVAADRLMVDADASHAKANAALDALVV